MCLSAILSLWPSQCRIRSTSVIKTGNKIYGMYPASRSWPLISVINLRSRPFDLTPSNSDLYTINELASRDKLHFFEYPYTYKPASLLWNRAKSRSYVALSVSETINGNLFPVQRSLTIGWCHYSNPCHLITVSNTVFSCRTIINIILFKIILCSLTGSFGLFGKVSH